MRTKRTTNNWRMVHVNVPVSKAALWERPGRTTIVGGGPAADAGRRPLFFLPEFPVKPFARAVVGCVAAAGVAAAVGGFVAADDKGKAPPAPPKAAAPEATVMERKLAHAHKVLEGLATADFEKIHKGADGLQQCVKDANWRINETERYLYFSTAFSENLADLQKAAKKKNIEAAGLAYADMTRTCVKCHQHLRDSR